MKEWAPLEVEIYKELFQAGREGNYDIYVVFIEQGLKLLNANGRLGFICPHKFFNAKYGEPVRAIIAEGQHLSHVVHFGDQQVFDGATTYTCLLFLEQSRRPRSAALSRLTIYRSGRRAVRPPKELSGVSKSPSAEWNFTVGKGSDLLDKLSEMTSKLDDVTNRIFQGYKDKRRQNIHS